MYKSLLMEKPLGGFTRAEDDFEAIESAEDDFLG